LFFNFFQLLLYQPLLLQLEPQDLFHGHLFGI
jgi:hypothetical protein